MENKGAMEAECDNMKKAFLETMPGSAKHEITTPEIIERSSEYLLEFDFVEFALLFGSFARGEASNLSDIDIGIFINKDISLLEHGNLIAGSEALLKRPVDIIVLNDIYKKKPGLAFDILKRNKLLLCRHEDRYVEFRKNALLYFMDSDSLRKEVDRTFKERLERGEFGKRNYVGTP